MSVVERLWATTLGLVTLGAVAAPAVYYEDGFPLSNYPMFSRAKDPVAQIAHVVGFSQDGRHRPVPPEAVGTDEIMQAYQTVRLAIRRGHADARALCRRAADWTADDARMQDIARLEVRVDAFDTIAYWKGARRPVTSRVVARCDVARGGPR